MNESIPTEAPKRENIWLNIGLNVLLPSLLMSKGKEWLHLEHAPLLCVALAFPLGYGIYDFVTRKKYNFFSILGFVSILITGGVGLLNLPKDWIAVKEAAIPALFAVAVLVSLKTRFPLVRTFLYNPELFDVPKIDRALDKNQTHPKFEKLMQTCTWYLAGSFVLSAVLNYGLAKFLIKSETDTDAFVQELGKMTLWSWPVITIPCMVVTMFALMKLLKGIKEYTGYDMEDVMHGAPAPVEAEAEAEAEAAEAGSDTSES
jgi:intracellular septation protein A